MKKISRILGFLSTLFMVVFASQSAFADPWTVCRANGNVGYGGQTCVVFSATTNSFVGATDAFVEGNTGTSAEYALESWLSYNGETLSSAFFPSTNNARYGGAPNPLLLCPHFASVFGTKTIVDTNYILESVASGNESSYLGLSACASYPKLPNLAAGDYFAHAIPFDSNIVLYTSASIPLSAIEFAYRDPNGVVQYIVPRTKVNNCVVAASSGLSGGTTFAPLFSNDTTEYQQQTGTKEAAALKFRINGTTACRSAFANVNYIDLHVARNADWPNDQKVTIGLGYDYTAAQNKNSQNNYYYGTVLLLGTAQDAPEFKGQEIAVPLGYYQATTCPDGQQRSSANKFSCVQCPSGTVRAAYSTAGCVACSGGKVPNAAQSACEEPPVYTIAFDDQDYGYPELSEGQYILNSATVTDGVSISYNVTYMYNGTLNEGENQDSGTYNDFLESGGFKLVGPKRAAGYTFTGFYTGDGVKMIGADGKPTASFTNTAFTADTTLYAQWEFDCPSPYTSDGVDCYIDVPAGYAVTTPKGSMLSVKGLSIIKNSGGKLVGYTDDHRVKYGDVSGFSFCPMVYASAVTSLTPSAINSNYIANTVTTTGASFDSCTISGANSLSSGKFIAPYGFAYPKAKTKKILITSSAQTPIQGVKVYKYDSEYNETEIPSTDLTFTVNGSKKPCLGTGNCQNVSIYNSQSTGLTIEFDELIQALSRVEIKYAPNTTSSAIGATISMSASVTLDDGETFNSVPTTSTNYAYRVSIPGSYASSVTYTYPASFYAFSPCPAGSYMASQSTVSVTQNTCTPASAGSYVATTGALKETKCAIGSYSGGTGNIGCTPCPAGKTNSATGSTTCTTSCSVTNATTYKVGTWNTDNTVAACLVSACTNGFTPSDDSKSCVGATYTISVDLNGGKASTSGMALKSVQLIYGNTVKFCTDVDGCFDAKANRDDAGSTKMTSEPTRDGYTFAGFYNKAGDTQLIDKDGYITDDFTPIYFNSNNTIYAKWDCGNGYSVNEYGQCYIECPAGYAVTTARQGCTKLDYGPYYTTKHTVYMGNVSPFTYCPNLLDMIDGLNIQPAGQKDITHVGASTACQYSIPAGKHVTTQDYVPGTIAGIYFDTEESGIRIAKIELYDTNGQLMPDYEAMGYFPGVDTGCFAEGTVNFNNCNLPSIEYFDASTLPINYITSEKVGRMVVYLYSSNGWPVTVDVNLFSSEHPLYNPDALTYAKFDVGIQPTSYTSFAVDIENFKLVDSCYDDDTFSQEHTWKYGQTDNCSTCPDNSSENGGTNCKCDTGYTLDGTLSGGTTTTSTMCSPIKSIISFSAASDVQASGGMLGKTVQATYGTVLPNLTDKTAPKSKITGNVFTGYYDAKTGGTQYYDANGNPMINIYKGMDDIDLYAQFTMKNVLTFEPMGGTINGTYTNVCDGDTATFTFPTDVTRPGYKFGGWYANNTYSGSPVTQMQKGSCTSNKTYYAKWISKVYVIDILTRGDSNITYDGTETIYNQYGVGIFLDAALTKKMTTTSNPIELPVKTGNKFQGYYQNQNAAGKKLITADGYITADLSATYCQPENERTYDNGATYECGSLYAYFEPMVYTVNLVSTTTPTTDAVPTKLYVKYGDKVYRDQNYTIEITGSDNKIAIPTLIGNTFDGYYTSNKGDGTRMIKPDGGLDALTATYWNDTTETKFLYARWTPTTYAINYVLDGGKTGASAPTTATYGSEITIAHPTHEHATFLGWKITGMDSGIEHIYGSDKTTENNIAKTTATTFQNLRSTSGTVTFTALWECTPGYNNGKCTANIYNIYYNKNADDATGEMGRSQHTYGTAHSLSKNTFTRPGWNFVGWNTQPDGSGTRYPDGYLIETGLITVSGGRIDLYAEWSQNTYECDPGTYLKMAETSCAQCPAGYACAGGSYEYSPSMDQGITVCHNGGYQNQIGQSTCKSCSAGTVTANDAKPHTTCGNCYGGTYQDQTGQSTCKSCSAGTYTTTTNAANKSCLTVDNGCYGTGTGASTSCPNKCSELTPAVSVTGGTYSSTGNRNTTTTCRYIAPSKSDEECSTITANTVSYSGLKWGSDYYTVTAKAGAYVSGTNAAPACSKCTGATWQMENNFTGDACKACPSDDSGRTESAPDGATNINECYVTCATKPTVTNASSISIVNSQISYNGTTYPTCTYSATCNNGYTASGNGTVSPSCTANKYTVTYDVNGGNAIENDEYTIETALTLPTVATKTGHIFNGWTLDGTKVTEIPRGSTGNKTVVAQWTPATCNTTNATANASVVDNKVKCDVTCNTGYSKNGDTDTTTTFAVTSTTNSESLDVACKARTFTISFDQNGGTGGQTEKITVKYNGTLGQVAFPTKVNNTFTGYAYNGTQYFNANGAAAISAYNVASDITVTATWVAGEQHTITYELYNGAFNGTHIKACQENNAEITLPTNVSKTGYTFAGWYDAATNGNKVTTIPANACNKNLTYYAKWTAHTYTVQYNANGGNGTMTNSSHTYDIAKALTANTFTRTDYRFLGWSDSTTATSAKYTDGASVKNLTSENGANVTLYAVWSACTACSAGTGATCKLSVVNNVCTYTTGCKTGYENIQKDGAYNPSCSAKKYTVTYNVNGGNAIANGEYTIETALTLPTVATKTGHIFNGWTLDGTKVTEIPRGSTGNKTVVAQWTPATCNTTNATANASVVDNKVKCDVTCNTGYSKNGDTDTTTTFAVTSTTNSESLDVACKARTFTISFDQNGGTGGQTEKITVKYNGTLGQVAFPTKVNNTFTGYAYNGTQYFNANGAAAISAYNVASDITVTATWVAGEQHTITYELYNGAFNGTHIKACQENNAEITLPTNVSKTGYTFAGWYDAATNGNKVTTIPANACNKNLTYYAKWTAHTYTVKYDANGGNGTMTNSSHTYDVAKALTANTFTRTDYRFLGWSDSTTATSAKYTDGASVKNLTSENGANVTLYAVWSACTACSAGTGATCKLSVVNNVCTYTTGCKTGYENIQKDGAYNPSCSAKKYTVTYECGEGDLIYGVVNTQQIAYLASGDLKTGDAVCRKAGYAFVKWTDGTNTYSSGESYTMSNASDVTLTATWKQSIINCNAGTYYAGSDTTCTTKCATGYYCPGGNYTIGTGEQGKKSCPTEYPKSSDNATKEDDCYKVVTVNGKTTQDERVPNGCSKITAYEACPDGTPGTCTYNDYKGKTDEPCTPTDCVQNPSKVEANEGYYVSGATCTVCPNGGKSSGGDNTINSCYQTKKCTANNGTGTQTCTYKNGDYTQCDTCNVESCPAGYELKDSVCTECPAGTYSADGTKCNVCDAGKYSDKKASTCTSCNTGYTNSGSTAASHAGAASCTTTCGAGQYVATAGQGCVKVGNGYWGTGGIVKQTETLKREQCPSGYPHSDDGANAKTHCYSDQKTREWNGSKVNGAIPTNCSEVTEWNECSGEVCTYVAYANAAGTGDGTVKSGCKTNEESCTNTVKTVKAQAGYYVDGTSCTVCPEGGTSDGGAIDAGQCKKSVTCTPTNGTAGTQTCYWNGSASAYAQGCTECVATTCSSGFYPNNGKCTECPAGSVCNGTEQVTCGSLSNGIYTQSDKGNSSSDNCYKECTISDLTNSENVGTVSGHLYFGRENNTCEIQSCKYNHVLIEGICVKKCECGTGYKCEYVGTECVRSGCEYNYRETSDGICEACDVENAISYMQNNNGMNCKVEHCAVGYHPQNGNTICEEDVRDCTSKIDHATKATETWSGKKFGSCTVTECELGYHIEKNKCVSDIRDGCKIIDKLGNERGVGRQEWDTDTGKWGECIATSCYDGYTNDSGLTNEPWEQCGTCSNKFGVNGEIAVSKYKPKATGASDCEIATCYYSGEKYVLKDNECRFVCNTYSDITGSRYWDESTKKCKHLCSDGYDTWANWQ